MDVLTTELLVILLLMLANGIFAMAEMALVTARKPRLKKLADAGDRRAVEVMALIEAPNRFLSTVQIGITVIGIFAGAFGGATLAKTMSHAFARIPWLAEWSDALGLSAVVVALTFLSLLIGELVPKRLALVNPEGVALALVGPVRRLASLSNPLVMLLGNATDFVLDLLGVRKPSEPSVSEDEVHGLIDQGLHAGIFHKAEKEMVRGVMRLDTLRVEMLMTPRAKIVWLSLDDPDEINWRRIVSGGHSHFPVYQGQRDNVVGMVSVKALWANQSLTSKAEIQPLLTPPTFVPPNMDAIKLLETFKHNGRHVALVADEFGTIQGLITLMDILEAVVGELPSRDQPRSNRIRRMEDGSWMVDALAEIDTVCRAVPLPELPGVQEGEYHTLGGFILNRIGRIPAEGEKIVWSGWRFEVVDMDGHRIDKIRVLREEAQPTLLPS
jgi:putative hemolysin